MPIAEGSHTMIHPELQKLVREVRQRLKTPRKDWIYRRDENRVETVTRIDYDRPLSGKAREELVGEFRVRCPADAQVVILADHGLGCIGPESLALIGIAKERGAKIVAIPR